MDFRDAAFNAVRELMRSDPAVMVATNDMGAMLLDEIRAEFPSRVLNVGIAEQNLIGIAAGLAMAGRRVFVYGIASHVTSRCLEQIKLDLCVMGLPVVILGVGAGLSYGNDGPSHHGTEDIGLLRPLPGIAIYNPCDWASADGLIREAYRRGGTSYVRLDREKPSLLQPSLEDAGCGLRQICAGERLLVLSTGVAVHRVLAAAQRLSSIAVVDVYRLKPTPLQALHTLFEGNAAPVAVVEEHVPSGGLFSLAAEAMVSCAQPRPLHRLGLPDRYLLGAAERSWAERSFGLDTDSLEKRFSDLCERKDG